MTSILLLTALTTEVEYTKEQIKRIQEKPLNDAYCVTCPKTNTEDPNMKYFGVD